MNILIVGLGEVGRAHAEVLSKRYRVFTKDVGPLEEFGKEGEAFDFDKINGGLDLLFIALNYHALGQERFMEVSRAYVELYKPKLVNILSTVAPGTTEQFGPNAVHSTTRGLHPNLRGGLLCITKHVGGPQADKVAQIFSKVGVRCVTHGRARTTELAHILNNSAYGVALMFADEAARLCREYGVDYYEAVMRYTATHNTGFKALDHERLVRPILTPPNGRIGGHCVTQGATLIPDDKRGWLLDRLAAYNGPQSKPLEPVIGGCITTPTEIDGDMIQTVNEVKAEADGTKRTEG